MIATDYTLPFWRDFYETRSGGQMTPRRWQQKAIDTFLQWVENRQPGDSRTFTVAASGGAGKTKFGAFIAKECEAIGIDRVVVICPSNFIAQKWIEDLHELGRDARLWHSMYLGSADIVTTYHMVAFHSHQLRQLIDKKTLLIADEFHHLAEGETWGVITRNLGSKAAYRIMLSATVFREDEAKIPLVTYTEGRLQTNFEYSYGEALNDGVVRPVYFKALDADSRWKIDSNLSNARLLADDNSTTAEQKALNAALGPSSEFMHTLIGMAHEQLKTIRNRAESANAAGIITCKDQTHARQILRLMQKITHTNPVLVISDDLDSDAKLDHFRESDDAWLVVVKKGSEGLDIPRLRVGIYATNILTELYFIQFLMRLIRQGEQGKKEDAYLFMPAHRKLIQYANDIRNMRVHALKETPVIESPKSESREKGESTVTTPIAAEAGETVEINIYADMPPLEKLIKIRELAAKTIDNVARGATVHPLSNSFGILDTLDEIATMLGVQAAAPTTNVQANLTPAQEFERKRQWNVFKDLFYQLQKMPHWYRDVLSFLWNALDDEAEITGVELADACQMSVSRFTTNWKRDLNPLIEAGLLATDIVNGTRVFQPYAAQHLLNICPNYDPEILMGYLLTGELPKEES